MNRLQTLKSWTNKLNCKWDKPVDKFEKNDPREASKFRYILLGGDGCKEKVIYYHITGSDNLDNILLWAKYNYKTYLVLDLDENREITWHRCPCSRALKND